MRVVTSWMGFMLFWDSRELPHLSTRWGHCKKAVIYKPASRLLSDITRICWHLDLGLLSFQEQWEINFCDLEETSSMVLSYSSPEGLTVSRMNATIAPLFRKKIKSNGRHQPLLSGSLNRACSIFCPPTHARWGRREMAGPFLWGMEPEYCRQQALGGHSHSPAMGVRAFPPPLPPHHGAWPAGTISEPWACF